MRSLHSATDDHLPFLSGNALQADQNGGFRGGFAGKTYSPKRGQRGPLRPGGQFAEG